MKKNTTAGKLLLEALFPAPALFLLLPVPAFHATPCLLLLFVFFHFTPVITFRFWFFCNFPYTEHLYKSQFVQINGLDFRYTLSGRQFPRSFLFPFSFLFFSIFSAAKHSSEDDNSEDVRLDLFLLEEDDCWLGCEGNSRFPCF